MHIRNLFIATALLAWKELASADETLLAKPETPRTSFLYNGEYDASLAVPTDAIRLYSFVHSPSWVRKGYATDVILHSRFGGNARKKPDDVQTDRDGNPWGVVTIEREGKIVDTIVGPLKPDLEATMIQKHGKGIRVNINDYYRVPTETRAELAKQQFASALEKGAAGVSFDEPEFWAPTGYSEAFKQEWSAKYGTPWTPPHESVDARYRCEQLKGFLFRRQLEAAFADVKQRNPSASRSLAMHSPLDYYRSGIVVAHHDLAKIPALQDVIAEVWTGTARVPVPIEGRREEHTFEVAYMEYSSFYHLLRGTDKHLWFLMDPTEDNPIRSAEDYQRNYQQTLLAALMFPQVERYEVLVWPNRIFGQVPAANATVINTVVGALSEMWRYPNGELNTGSEGIGTFVADSMGWQRADPSFSDFDGFYGLTLPLVRQGIPVQILSLDRVGEPGYLKGLNVLLVSYDFLKPSGSDLNRALADWVRQGGQLVFFGGTDAYNSVADSWWRKAGHTGPGEDLFAQLGLPISRVKTSPKSKEVVFLRSTSNAWKGAPDSLTISHDDPVTINSLPQSAAPLYHMATQTEPVVWKVAVGRGGLLYVGIGPGYLSKTVPASRWLRSLVEHVLKKTGTSYREQQFFQVQRGPYTAVRTLAEAHTIHGRFVDLLSPNLDVLLDPLIPANKCSFLMASGPADGAPRLMAVSGRLRMRSEQQDVTRFQMQAPAGTDGVARLWAGDRKIEGVKAATRSGASVPVDIFRDNDTVRLRYENDADGVVVDVRWVPGSRNP